ncbi:MAG: hypothetical protein Q9190_000393 [Brigantiaea leucoxantha]
MSQSLFKVLLCVFAISVSCCSKAQTVPYDVREATIESVQNALNGGLTTCRAIVESFITRIEAYNPTINAIISLNPNALSAADEMDLALTKGNATGLLFCVPILLKDNFDTAEIPTTGGCLDLAASQPRSDGPVVTAFKQANAIILGKTNLHELALEGLSVSSLGGQTINPYDFTRTPGGSSGGTGAAIASSFAGFGTGTDTVNSLRSPASANSLFSIRPTYGLISRAGVIPICYTQDAVGVIARNINDLAIALNVMASIGYDPRDNVTAQVPPSVRKQDYTAQLHSTSLQGMRFGLLEGFINRTSSNETDPVNAAIDAAVSALSSAGATVIPITDPIYNATAISAKLDVQQFEYREQLSTYLSSPSLSGDHPSSMPDLYSSKNFLVIPSQYSYVNTALVSSTSNSTYARTRLGIQNLTLALASTFTANHLDFLIYPEQRNLVAKIGSASQSGRNGILATLTGYPVVTVPIGFSGATESAPRGVPIGMEILGRQWDEGRLLGIGKRISEVRRVRRMPQFTEGVVEARRYDNVPVVRPNRDNIAKAYPLGVLGK